MTETCFSCNKDISEIPYDEVVYLSIGQDLSNQITLCSLVCLSDYVKTLMPDEDEPESPPPESGDPPEEAPSIGPSSEAIPPLAESSDSSGPTTPRPPSRGTDGEMNGKWD